MLAAAAAANAAKALDRYHIMDKIGEGTYGEVFKAMDRNEKNRPVALKKIRLDMDDDGIPPTALREVSLLMELNHENVIRLLDVVQVPNSLYLVFDFIDTDLKKCMESSIGDFSLESVKSLLYQLLAGIAYCHGRRVLHRDLKPQNLLVDRTSGKLLIADFGLSRTFRLPNRSHTHEVVTLWYRAPEILLGSPHYNTAVDIWSCGCILGEMLTGKPLFAGESEIDQLFRIFRARGTPSALDAPSLTELPTFQSQFPKWKTTEFGALVPSATPEAIELLAGLLAYEPKRRLSAREAMRHSFFDGLGVAPVSVSQSAWPSAFGQGAAAEAKTTSSAGPPGALLGLLDIAAAAELLPSSMTPTPTPRRPRFGVGGLG